MSALAPSRAPAPSRRLRLRLGIVVLVLAASAGVSACKPLPVSCKTTLYKYDHQTAFVTWFTLYNEMRFCSNAATATSIDWATNRTSSPSFPYTNNGVSDSTGMETYGQGALIKRARNTSYHSIGCAKIAGGFTVTMRQLGYHGGTVTKWRSSISSSTDC